MGRILFSLSLHLVAGYLVCVHFATLLLVTDIDHDVTLGGNNVIKGTGISSHGSISIWLSEALSKITPGHGREEERGH